MQGAASPSAPGPTDLTQRCLVAERLATYTRKVTSTPPPGGRLPQPQDHAEFATFAGCGQFLA